MTRLLIAELKRLKWIDQGTRMAKLGMLYVIESVSLWTEPNDHTPHCFSCFALCFRLCLLQRGCEPVLICYPCVWISKHRYNGALIDTTYRVHIKYCVIVLKTLPHLTMTNLPYCDPGVQTLTPREMPQKARAYTDFLVLRIILEIFEKHNIWWNPCILMHNCLHFKHGCKRLDF